MRKSEIWMVTCVFLSLSSLAIVAGGCIDRDLGPLNPRVGRAIDEPVSTEGVTEVDLLLVIDDSQSMREEQELLEREIPALVRGLTEPPDLDGDGEPDWNPVLSLRVAVVTTDLGTNGQSITSLGGCGESSVSNNPLGPDGHFRVGAGCGGDASGIQRWQAGEDVDTFVDRVACVADAGISGCGFEQPLAAAAKALSRQAETGFPSEDALLAVLVLTDEEDCSVADPARFYGSIPNDAAGINRYCTSDPSLTMDTTELVQALSLGRDESRFVFAAIAGVPTEVAGEDPATILADPDMQYVPDDGVYFGLRPGLAPACTALNDDGSARSVATPARRIAELAAEIPGSLVRSICEDDFRPAVAELVNRIGKQLDGVCLSRGLEPADDGSVACYVEEVLPVGIVCDDVPGRSSLGTDASSGRAKCEIAQAPDGLSSGWFYRAVDGCEEIAFTDDALPPIGSRLRFRCLVEVPDEDPTGP